MGATRVSAIEGSRRGRASSALETFLLASFLTYGSLDFGVGGPALPVNGLALDPLGLLAHRRRPGQ